MNVVLVREDGVDDRKSAKTSDGAESAAIDENDPCMKASPVSGSIASTEQEVKGLQSTAFLTSWADD